MSGAPGGTVALVTCAAHPQLSADDRLLLPVLAEAGFEPVARLWDDSAEPWARHAAVVVRSCWDYHHRPREFHAWLDRLTAEGARVFNPVPLLRWNADKRYLRDLADAGIEVIPTAWVAERDEASLADLAGARGWRHVVVKPSVSATAFETWRAGPVVTGEDEERFRRAHRRAACPGPALSAGYRAGGAVAGLSRRAVQPCGAQAPPPGRLPRAERLRRNGGADPARGARRGGGVTGVGCRPGTDPLRPGRPVPGGRATAAHGARAARAGTLLFPCGRCGAAVRRGAHSGLAPPRTRASGSVLRFPPAIRPAGSRTRPPSNSPPRAR